MPLPTPHLDKINAAITNEKMPATAVERMRTLIPVYNQWITNMANVQGETDVIIEEMVRLFNDYKFHVDFNLIFSSDDDFLYRQKGQLKLDNSVIEEFLPHLVQKVFPQLSNISLGPIKCFSAAYFKTSFQPNNTATGLTIRTKDQDFAIAKKLYLKASHNTAFTDAETVETYLGYLAAECKTNLDKTMFQEATATANDIKSAVPGAKYFLLCEWLDMTPVSTAPTDIEEVLILRKAKRMSSDVRKAFGTNAGRMEKAEWYRNFLQTHPFDINVFKRFISHIEKLITDEDPVENTVLEDGYF